LNTSQHYHITLDYTQFIRITGFLKSTDSVRLCKSPILHQWILMRTIMMIIKMTKLNQ